MIIDLIFVYLNWEKDANDHNSTQDRTDTYRDSSDRFESSHPTYINYTLCCTSKSNETEPPKGKYCGYKHFHVFSNFHFVVKHTKLQKYGNCIILSQVYFMNNMNPIND